MATFVLVHGAWRGGWCWMRVTPLLRAAGHEVFTVTLTGLGERAHLLTRDTDLDTHIADVVNTFEFEDLHDVVLVGHSYGGAVITGAADRVIDRVRALYYVDAHVPPSGQDLFTGMHEARRELFLKGMNERGDGWLIPIFPAEKFGALRAEDAAWIDGHCTPHPAKTMLTMLTHGDPTAKIDNLTYIRAEKYASPQFDEFYARFGADPRWHTEMFPCGHDIMVDMPERLAESLIAAAAR